MNAHKFNLRNLLAIETSCDETAAAVLREGKRLMSNVVASQVHVHREYGGIVPELASRHHLEDIVWVVEKALKKGDVGSKAFYFRDTKDFISKTSNHATA